VAILHVFLKIAFRVSHNAKSISLHVILMLQSLKYNNTGTCTGASVVK